MAHFYPSNSPEGAPSSELRVRGALRTLDDSWHVFHQVRWQSMREGRQGDGEADFVLLHQARGLLVFEVKGGRISVANGQWSTIDRNDVSHSIKDPFRQAVASKHALLLFLKTILPRVPSISHSVVFPDVHVSEAMGLHPREIIVDGTDLNDAAAFLKRLLFHWDHHSVSLSKNDLRKIIQALAPSLRIERRLKVSVSSSEAEVLELTGNQIRTLSGLRRNRKCAVVGGAGTGKTVLAIEKVKQLSALNGKVLFLCFNELLADFLRAQIARSADVFIGTFHAYCFDRFRRMKRAIPSFPTDVWWSTTAAKELSACSADTSEKDRFDALVVDEAQDFRSEWLDALETQLRGAEGLTFLFADPHQALFQRGHELPSSWPTYELDTNCRNTRPIAAAAAFVIGDTQTVGAAEGRPVSYIESTRENSVAICQTVIDRLILDEKLESEDIVTLVDSASTQAHLMTCVAGGRPFVAVGENGLCVETIQRFKGLEAPVVVLLLTHLPASLSEEIRSLLYVAATRARSFLVVIGPPQAKRWLDLK